MKYFRYLINYIFSIFYDLYYYFFGDIRSRIQGVRYYAESNLYPDYLKRGNMVEAVLDQAAEYCVGKGVDVGAGKWTLTGARAIENKPDENAYHIREADSSLDFVFSSHCLEHLDRWQEALHEWQRVLKPEGILFLYLPHPVCEMWKVGVNPQHVWTPTSPVVSEFLTDTLHMKIEAKTTIPDVFLSFMIVASK